MHILVDLDIIGSLSVLTFAETPTIFQPHTLPSFLVRSAAEEWDNG